MQAVSNSLRFIGDKILVVLCVLYVLIPYSPLKMPLASSDSGVFLYIGWRILNGELPYKNIWDHKPPIIFYLNALGLAFTNNSRWGVWLLEFLGLILAAWIGFILIKRVMGALPAYFSLAIWLLTLFFVLDGGNLPEEYVLPIQFASLLLILDANKVEKDKQWHYFVIGLLTGLTFFLKQTSIGIGLAIVIYLVVHRIFFRQLKKLFGELLLFASGILSITIPIVIFFAIQGALDVFWDAAFRYNLIYSLSNVGFLSRLFPVTNGILPLTYVGLFQLGLMGYLISLYLLITRNSLIDGCKSLLIICLINLPIELVLVSTSGNVYVHYYMSLLPALAMFTSLLFWMVLLQLSQLGMHRNFQAVFTFTSVLIFVWSSYGNYIITSEEEYNQFWNVSAIPYIKANTSSNDTVLIWGAESAINFYTERRSPSRYVYQFPLYKINYANEKNILEFLNDIIQNRPRLIIDANNKVTPMFDFPVQTESIQNAINYIQTHYRKIDNLNSWKVYQYYDP